ncbi:hypothetical protein DFH06DRAFT_727066 [Mycena polygramma]|nr:hypothetical protein DFH06DRAFT_727066 [Mycena polygramma]
MPKKPSSPQTPKATDSRKQVRSSEHHETLETPKRDDRRRRLLNRWERALCRVLDRYGVNQEDLAGHLQCAVSTVTRAVKNSYTDPDTHVENDGEILQSDSARFNVALEKLVQVQGVHSHPQVKSGSGGQQVENTGDKLRPKSSKSKPCTGSKASGSSGSSPPSIATKTEFAATDADADDLNLFLFVVNVPLDAGWYTEVKKAGFTMEKLRRLAGIAREDVERLIGKRFPKMNELDRLLFVTAVKAPNTTH